MAEEKRDIIVKELPAAPVGKHTLVRHKDTKWLVQNDRDCWIWRHEDYTKCCIHVTVRKDRQCPPHATCLIGELHYGLHPKKRMLDFWGKGKLAHDAQWRLDFYGSRLLQVYAEWLILSENEIAETQDDL